MPPTRRDTTDSGFVAYRAAMDPQMGIEWKVGKLPYRFVIEVPESLSPEQTEAVDKLSEVMEGDPRARLFQRAAGAGA